MMMTDPAENWSTSKMAENPLIKSMAMAIGLFGISYLLWKVVSLRGDDLTFRYIWLAGRLWIDAVNPYSSEYQVIGHELFATFNGQPFYYPPNWWPLSTFLGGFEYEFAMEIWRILNATMIIISTFLLNAGLKRCGVHLSPAYVIFYLGLSALMQATVISLATGQTTLILYFGICLIISGTLSAKSSLQAIGFCLVLLKPQIGVPLMIGFIAFRKYHLALFYASLLTFLMTLPGLISIGPVHTVTSYLQGLSHHSDFITNGALNSTGLKNLIFTVTKIEISSNISTALAIFFSLVAGFYFKRAEKKLPAAKQSQNLVMFLVLNLTLVSFLSPLHEYDMVILAPIILLAVKFPLPVHALISIPFLILVRPKNIVDLFGNHTPVEARYYAGVLITLSIMAILITLLRKIIRPAQ